MKRFILLGILFAVLAAMTGCESSKTGKPMPLTTNADRMMQASPDSKYSSPHYKKLTTKEKWQCLINGGDEVTSFTEVYCSLPARDAGKKCKTSKDCEGNCMTDTLTCSKLTPYDGCDSYINDDGKLEDFCV